MWMVIVACHCWCIKLRHICDMAETSLVVRDGNGNCNSSPTFVFSIWGHPRIPHISKNMNTSCRRKTNNGKKTRRPTRLIHFERSNAIEICNGIMFNFYPGLPHFIQISTTLLARFPRYQKRIILRDVVEVVCNTHFCLSLLSFLHLASLQDIFCRRFLIMRDISIVLS